MNFLLPIKLFNIVNYIKDYIKYDEALKTFSTIDLVRLIIDTILVLGIFCAILIFLINRLRRKNILIYCAIYLVILTIALFTELKMFSEILIFGLIAFGLIIIVNYAPELKNAFSGFKYTRTEKSFLTTEETKEELIDTLIKTVEHLTSRKIGAIITIEKEHSLNTYIEKGVKLESLVSFELLDTIFFPNTALHDGAVIIRGNQIVCAGAFYPPSENPEIPKQLGSRHRAAIGISEVTDAFTIVLSEETGHISTTIDGTITQNSTIDSLRVSLQQNIIVK